MESSPGPEVMVPSVTNVAELEAMTPPFFSPMKAMNILIPIEMV